MTKQIKSITVVTSNYPAPGHAANVFVQQLVHAMIEQGVKVAVIAYQSIVHSLVYREKPLPRHSKGVTETGVKYDIYRPYTVSVGKRNNKFVGWLNKRIITHKVAAIKSDILYCHFWSSALHVYEYALAKELPLFVACGEGDNALEEMVESMSKDSLNNLAKSVTGVVSVSSENKRKCIEFGLTTPSNIDVFPNCVNTAVFHKMDVSGMRKKIGIKEDDFVICFVGGFVPRKGPNRLAQAISKLNDSHIKVMFIGKPMLYQLSHYRIMWIYLLRRMADYSY